MIKSIHVNESNILFCGDKQKTFEDVEFWGVYYSLNGQPQIVFGENNGELAKDGSGWSYTDGKVERYYYTEKIKESFYLYTEGQVL